MPRKQKPIQQKPGKPAAKQADVVDVTPMPAARNFSLSRVQLLIVAILGFALYVNTISFDFTLDDAIVITNNQFTKQGFAGLKDIFTKDTFHGFFGTAKQLVAGGRYRPLTLVMFATEYQLFGQNSHVNHFINVLLYSLSGIVILLLLRRLLAAAKSPGTPETFWNIPFIATLLFMAHPIHTEAVANIKGRDEILCLLLSLLSVYWLFRYHDTRKTGYFAGGLIVFFLALLTKENAITFVALIPLTFYFFSDARPKQILGYSVPILVVAGIYWIIRTKITGDYSKVEITEVLNNPFVVMNAAQRYATIMFTFGKYLLLLVIPHPLTHDYYYNQIPAQDWGNVKVLLSLVANVGIGAWALLHLKRKHVLAFAVAYYFITLSVVSNVFVPIGTTMGERFIYFSSLGFCIALAYGLSYFLSKAEKAQPVNISDALVSNRNLAIAVGLIVLAYSGKTIVRNYVWSDNLTLFVTDVETSPNSAKLENSVGGELMAAADKEQDTAKRRVLMNQSFHHLQKALSVYPNYSIAWMLLGNNYFKGKNDLKNAIACYKNSLALNPEFTDAISNIALAYKQTGENNNALKYSLKLLSVRPNDPAIWISIGEIQRKRNAIDSALICYKQALALHADYTAIYSDIGNVYAQNKGNMDSALVYYRIALEKNPKDQSTMINMGIALGIKKRFEESIAVFEKAMPLNPNNASLYANMAIVYGQKGNKKAAEELMKKANAMMAPGAKH